MFVASIIDIDQHTLPTGKKCQHAMCRRQGAATRDLTVLQFNPTLCSLHARWYCGTSRQCGLFAVRNRWTLQSLLSKTCSGRQAAGVVAWIREGCSWMVMDPEMGCLHDRDQDDPQARRLEVAQRPFAKRQAGVVPRPISARSGFIPSVPKALQV